jgi:arylsulfatase A-like enzyme
VLAPPPFDTLYDPDDIPIRWYDESAYRTRAAYDRRRADTMRIRDMSPEQVRQMWADYMGLVACVDHEMGRLLSTLRRLGLDENTIVLFSADHGKSLGEWGATEKGFYDSEVWRVPMILAGPGVEARGTVDEDICELIDTGRTLLALAGLEAPDGYRGRDLLHDPAPEAVYAQIGWPDVDAPLYQRAFAERISEVPSARGLSPISRPPPSHTQMRVALRTARYRMDVTWYQDGQRLPFDEADGNLFDLQADPGETRNLWANPEMQPVVEDLWRKLEDWFANLDRPAELFSAQD